MATLYDKNDNGKLVVDSPDNENYRQPPTFPMGGTTLVSTPRDYFRFVQMLVNRGELDDVRILKGKTVDLMTRDHLSPSLGADPLNRSKGKLADATPQKRRNGFGFTMEIRIGRQTRETTSFAWGGWAGTVFWGMPKREAAVFVFTQSKAHNGLGKRIGIMSHAAFLE